MLDSERNPNPFKNAFSDIEYQEPNEDELKASQEIVDKYNKDRSEEEKAWFIKAEEDLLRQLINDYQLEEFIGGIFYLFNLN